MGRFHEALSDRSVRLRYLGVMKPGLYRYKGGRGESILGWKDESGGMEEAMKHAKKTKKVAPPATGKAGAPVLAPVDFSETSLAALELAASTALQRGAELIVLTVASWPGVDLGYLHSPMEKEEALRKLEEAFRERVLDKDPRWPPEWKPVFLVREGLPPADEILRVVREKGIGMIVMGTHGRTGLAHAVLGSVTEKMIREAPCPVLACRAAKGASPGAGGEAKPVLDVEASVIGKGGSKRAS